MDSSVLAGQEADSIRKLIAGIKLLVFDFDGVFTDNRVYVFEDGREAVCCNRQDGLGLRKLDELGLDYFILSTEANPVVQARARKLRIRCVNCCDNKLEYLNRYLSEHNLTLQQTAFVGNDINDSGCLQQVGFPITVADAHDSVQPFARYTTEKTGGHGAVREVCDLLYDRLKSTEME